LTGAYFGDKLLKSSRISQVKKKIDDGVVHGTGDSEKPYQKIRDELNIPIELAYLEDSKVKAKYQKCRYCEKAAVKTIQAGTYPVPLCQYHY
jgi:hypothetical protein